LSLIVYAGTNYTVSGDSVTPVSGFSGTLKVVVAVSDGIDTSATDTVSVFVREEPPVVANVGAIGSDNSLSAQVQGQTIRLSYSISRNADVAIVLYNLTGAEVLRLQEGLRTPGVYTLQGETTGLGFGRYISVLKLNGRPVARNTLSIRR
ncbi:MAG TPA: hypothetical protein VLM37_02940, partial [Fibrobacteraceae bacterium]|nr:hypothetical protein [Fibrobacteraceae bacterium]